MRTSKYNERVDDINRFDRTLSNRTVTENNIGLDNLLWNIINETVVFYNDSNPKSHSFNRRTLRRVEYLELFKKIQFLYERVNRDTKDLDLD